MSFIHQNNRTIYAENVSCTSHIVVEVESGRVLSGDNIDKRLPMASTTKIMTALVAIESGKLHDMVTITHNMVGIEGSSIYLREGEVLTVEELLYGLMMRSGNDSAVAIAIGVGGDIDSFVDMMNYKVKSLGLQNTHFTNPHGLHNSEHYTSAYDLAMISACAMRNETFREIVGTKSKVIGGETSTKRYLVNKNKMLRLYDGANGIKTGYTKVAGRCLVSSAKRNGMTLVSVVLNEPNMWEVSASNMDNAFDKYHLLELARKDRCIGNVDIKGKICKICTHNTIYYPIREDEREDLNYELIIDDIKGNVKLGENIGKLVIYSNKHLLFEEKIYTM